MTAAYRDFLRRHKSAYDPEVEKAFALAEEAHSGQLRHSGEPYFIHPLAVSDIIADLGLDNTTIIAGVLHDVVEDTDVTLEDISNMFSPEIAKLVDGVTKLRKIDFKSREEQQSETLRKMFLAMARDIRVVIIKLADRLHNMRTLKFQSENKQREKALETLEVYAPLAHRLGISAIKWELEDLSLKFLEPDEYYEIANKIVSTRKEREQQLMSVIDRIEDHLAEMRISADIEGRPKHIYSIYKKMHEQDKTFDEVYDLIAIRVIVSSIKDCYGVLGLVHTMWKPIPMRFKDYIAVPKENMYQSLHTTVLGDDGKPFEVQVRTYDMQRTAEYGIAAHWKYKERSTEENDLDEKLAWLRELMEWQNDVKDSKEFMESLKIDLFAEHVLVFTPNGEVKDFPAGATPLDFAYSIHSDVGDRCVGARVNGKIVALDYEMKTGDIVEIITSRSSPGPSADWLQMVKTAQAKNKIKHWIKRERKEDSVIKGREAFEKEAKRQGYRPKDLLRPGWLSGLFKRFTLKNENDMFAAIGYGDITVTQVLSKLAEQYLAEVGFEEEAPAARVVRTSRQGEGGGGNVEGHGTRGLSVRFGKCCNPVPGDDIVGYVTKGRGVCVHTRDCRTLRDMSVEKERLVDLHWVEDSDASYEVEVQIVADDRKGLVAEITQVLSGAGRDITSLNASAPKKGIANIFVRTTITSVGDMNSMMQKMRDVKGVHEVYRMYT